MTDKAIHFFWAAYEGQVHRVKCYHAGSRGIWRAPELEISHAVYLKEGVTLFEDETAAWFAAVEQCSVKRAVYGERLKACTARLLQITDREATVARPKEEPKG